MSRAHIVNFAVDGQAAGTLEVAGRIDVHVAHAIGVRERGDARVTLDVRHQRVAAARNHLPARLLGHLLYFCEAAPLALGQQTVQER